MVPFSSVAVRSQEVSKEPEVKGLRHRWLDHVLLLRAQMYDRLLRRRQIAYMIYECFRSSGAYDAAQGLPSSIAFK